MPTPLSRSVFAIGVSLFATTAVAGFVRSLQVDHHLPPLDGGLAGHLRVLMSSDRMPDAVREMRLSATIDTENSKGYLDSIAAIAHRLDDRDSEIFARSQIAIDRPDDSDAHAWLARALLANADATPAELVRAEQHSRRALELQPASIQGRASLAAVLWRSGQLDAARKQWGELRSQYPSNTERLRKDFAAHDPAFADAMRAEGAGGARQ